MPESSRVAIIVTRGSCQTRAAGAFHTRGSGSPRGSLQLRKKFRHQEPRNTPDTPKRSRAIPGWKSGNQGRPASSARFRLFRVFSGCRSSRYPRQAEPHFRECRRSLPTQIVVCYCLVVRRWRAAGTMRSRPWLSANHSEFKYLSLPDPEFPRKPKQSANPHSIPSSLVPDEMMGAVRRSIFQD